jgi:hypothetical protein
MFELLPWFSGLLVRLKTFFGAGAGTEAPAPLTHCILLLFLSLIPFIA